MKTSKKKITLQEWGWLACLAVISAVGTVAISIVASKPPVRDHPVDLLNAPDVIAWYELTQVKFAQRDGKSVLQFGDRVNALDGKSIKLRGYITPLQFGTDQKHFILSPKPPSCAFCVPAGPDEMVEVYSKTPVKYSLDPVTISGVFAVLPNDPGGLMYRMADAVAVSSEGRL
jgi:uncharacterized protein